MVQARRGYDFFDAGSAIWIRVARCYDSLGTIRATVESRAVKQRSTSLTRDSVTALTIGGSGETNESLWNDA